MGRLIIAVFLFFVCIPAISFALTPIARTDVVPHQRIEYGATFNFGVVAFSKEGIDRVEFTISGQGYSGGVKTANQMTYNSQTDVWEYWVAIASSEFTGNGTITVTPATYGVDAGFRSLDVVSLYVEGASDTSPLAAWVDATNGNDTTGEVGNSNLPYLSIAAAISAAQTANGGTSDGNIIYLKNGTYSLSGSSASTATEWLTIAGDTGTDIDNVIINAGYVTTDKLHVKDIRVVKSGSGWVFSNENMPDKLWLDSCKLIGSGLWVSQSNPMVQSVDEQYITDTYMYNIDYGTRNTKIIRGSHIEHFGNDAMFNSLLVINVLLNDQNNGATGLHSDGYQAEYLTVQGLPEISNRILYNVKMLDMHVSGVFMQSTSGQANDMAFVNVMVEQREPGMTNESGEYSQTNIAVENSWNHLLIWNCSFPHSYSYLAATTTTNASVVGNIFADFRTSNASWADYENIYDNEFLHNHFIQVYNETPACDLTSAATYYSWPCPQDRAARPDSGVTDTSTVGDGIIEADYTLSTYGTPVVGSVLLNRFTSKVPVDINGAARGVASDIGAVERVTETTITCYPDVDNDLYPGTGSETVETCSTNYYMASHFAAMTADCNDASASINPGATDTCGNSIDEDCSGSDATCPAGTIHLLHLNDGFFSIPAD